MSDIELTPQHREYWMTVRRHALGLLDQSERILQVGKYEPRESSLAPLPRRDARHQGAHNGTRPEEPGSLLEEAN